VTCTYSSRRDEFGRLNVIIGAVSESVLPVLAQDLQEFGVKVHFETEWSGTLECASGKMRFHYENSVLSVVVIVNLGHFPDVMLCGGIRQLVEEAIERHGMAATA
jgi:hypothetical protein